MSKSTRIDINELTCNTNNKCQILHHKQFRADYILRSTKIGASSAARILIQVRYSNNMPN